MRLLPIDFSASDGLLNENGERQVVGELTLITTYIKTGRKSSAPGGLSFDAMETLSNKLLITRQQLRIHTSLSRGALYVLIFCSSF